MTPIDIAFWAMIVFLILSAIVLVLGVLTGDIEVGCGFMILFLMIAFGAFIIWSLLWISYMLVTGGQP